MPIEKRPSKFALRRNKPAYMTARTKRAVKDSFSKTPNAWLFRYATEHPENFYEFIKTPEAPLAYLNTIRADFKSAYRIIKTEGALKDPITGTPISIEKLRETISRLNTEIKRKTPDKSNALSFRR